MIKATKCLAPITKKNMWQIFSVEDPVQRCCNGNSSNELEYYQSKFIPFVWNATVQFGSAVNMKETLFVNCDNAVIYMVSCTAQCSTLMKLCGCYLIGSTANHVRRHSQQLILDSCNSYLLELLSAFHL